MNDIDYKGISTGIFWFTGSLATLVAVLFVIMFAWAHFKLWKVEYSGRALEIEQTYAGKAILAKATNAKLARIEQARAEKESAQLTADAITIVGKAAQDYPEYRTQEFLLSFGDALREGKINQIMYVPTEANIPITEATRLK